MSLNDSCFIWGTPASIQYEPTDPLQRTATVDSPRVCGKYIISERAKCGAGQLSSKDKTKLTTWIIEQNRFGINVPTITTSVISDTVNAKELSVTERAIRLLMYLEMINEYPGCIISCLFSDKLNKIANGILAWSESIHSNEAYFLLKYLDRNELIDITAEESGGGISFYITVEGFVKADKYKYSISKSIQGFVAMWFDDVMFRLYEDGIKPAILKAGYIPLRIDQKKHINKIDDEIIAEIRRSLFMVADFSCGEQGARGGVYYEAGFARGLGIPIFSMCNEESVTHLHFDTRQYNHIIYKTADEVVNKLANSISAILGDGPNLSR